MRYFILFFIYLFLNGQNVLAQKINFKELLDSIDWNTTEMDLIYNFRNNIEKIEHDEWKEKNETSDYQFKNIYVGDLNFSSAVIRVDATTRKLIRVNFKLNRVTDFQKKEIENYINKILGEYALSSKDSAAGKLFLQTKTWLTQYFKLDEICFSNSDECILSVEPLALYPVIFSEAKVIANPSNTIIPKLEYCAIANNNDVYIKYIDEKEAKIIHKRKIIDSPVGAVIFLVNDSFVCYRKSYADIIYGKNGTAFIYPVKSK